MKVQHVACIEKSSQQDRKEQIQMNSGIVRSTVVAGVNPSSPPQAHPVQCCTLRAAQSSLSRALPDHVEHQVLLGQHQF